MPKPTIATHPPIFYDRHEDAVNATRKAVDPYGIDGEQQTATRPTASEVLQRLWTLGFIVVKREEAKPR